MKKNSAKSNRALSFGLNSAFLTLVVLAIVGVVNFAAQQYPQKLDTTKNKLHTFSDQSEKVMKGLTKELHATLYGDFGTREKYRPVIDNYKKLSNKFKFELVDPNKEPTRAKTAGIKKMETLVLTYGEKTSKIEEITEEKVTNEIIKLTKDTKQVVCAITGHGEKSITDAGQDGYASVKKGLEDQSYAVKEFTLSQEAKIPADCTAIAIFGPNKAFFPNEIKILNDYLNAGGRAVIALEAAVAQVDQSKEIRAFLHDWGVDMKGGLIIDPVSRMLGVEASVPIFVTFNNDQTIGKDFKQQCYFPFTRPVDLVNPAPSGLTTTWLAKTTPKAWGEMDMNSIAKGAVQFNQGTDIPGPLTGAVVVTGKKDPKAAKETRLVVFGSAQFANNQFSRFGGNADLILNSISWTLEDESMISIRTKEDEAGHVELSQQQGIAIFWTAVVIIPLMIAALGIVIWVRRKKL
ncbi:MAG: GldG family protein [Bdellovibrionales bacterium]|nr:GldG family protein [Bdellovibrionales bacterium]